MRFVAGVSSGAHAFASSLDRPSYDVTKSATSAIVACGFFGMKLETLAPCASFSAFAGSLSAERIALPEATEEKPMESTSKARSCRRPEQHRPEQMHQKRRFIISWFEYK